MGGHKMVEAHNTLFPKRNLAAIRTLCSSQGIKNIFAQVQPSHSEVFDDPPRHDGEALVLFDCHVPYHDADFINHCMALALLWNVDTCIFGGDTFDMAALSSFVNRPTETLRKEGEAGIGLVDAAATNFSKVYLFNGNHEARWIHYMKEQLGHEELWKAMGLNRDNVSISEYYFLLLGDEWLLEHPRNVSVVPARVPFFLASKYQRNVCAGHGHTWGMTQDITGTRVAIDAGVCCDPLRLDYIARRHNTRPAVTQGACIFTKKREGGFYPHLLHPKFSDFERMMA